MILEEKKEYSLTMDALIMKTDANFLLGREVPAIFSGLLENHWRPCADTRMPHICILTWRKEVEESMMHIDRLHSGLAFKYAHDLDQAESCYVKAWSLASHAGFDSIGFKVSLHMRALMCRYRLQKYQMVCPRKIDVGIVD